MHIGFLLAFVLLTIAGGLLFMLLTRVRDWRAGIIVAWLVATALLMAATVQGQLDLSATWLGGGPRWLSQLAISGLTLAAAIISQQAFQHDSLTGLPNRTFFVARLRRAVRRLKPGENSAFAVLSLNLDRFKAVNQSLGREVGDKLLIDIAKRLPACIDPGDMVARMGGDEFFFLLHNAGRSDAVAAAEHIHQQLSRPTVLDGHEVVAGCSIGIALGSISLRQRPADLLRDADVAMSRAQELGTAVQVFDRSMRDRAVERLAIESSLRGAVGRGELTVHYQPIVGLRDGRIVGFEALVRWRHPEWGLLLPDDFIPIAEETGLINSIGLWVLEEACRQMAAWQTRSASVTGALIHVNLSSRQFMHQALVGQIADVLARTALSPGALGLEITESVIMEDVRLASTMLSELRSLGVRLQIDDFGTGYSSLASLQRLPVDTIKIDRSFVSTMQTNDDNTKIVKAIVSLARELELRVIAEGVECCEHVSALLALGCETGQGNYFGEAAGPAAMDPFLRTGRLPVPSGSKPASGRGKTLAGDGHG